MSFIIIRKYIKYHLIVNITLFRVISIVLNLLKSIGGVKMSVQEKLSFLDLPALNSSPAGVRDKFKRIYGVNPDGVSIKS